MDFVTVGIILLLVFAYFNFDNQKKIFDKLLDIEKRLDLLIDDVEQAKLDIEGKIDSLEDAITSDDVKVKDLVRMGFDEGDAREFVINK